MVTVIARALRVSELHGPRDGGFVLIAIHEFVYVANGHVPIELASDPSRRSAGGGIRWRCEIAGAPGAGVP